jgi:hypothetical protein
MLLTALFGGLSDMAYPIDLNELPPIATRLLGKNLNIHFDVTDIRTADDRLIIHFKSIPKIEKKKKK